MADSVTVAATEVSVTPADPTAAYARALHELLASTHLAAPDELPAVVLRAAAHLGAADAALYLVDYEQQTLSPFTGSDVKPRDVQSVPAAITL